MIELNIVHVIIIIYANFGAADWSYIFIVY